VLAARTPTGGQGLSAHLRQSSRPVLGRPAQRRHPPDREAHAIVADHMVKHVRKAVDKGEPVQASAQP